MKTDKKKLLSEVKACLDYASWNYYYSSNKDFDDTEKACDYLSSQGKHLLLIKKTHKAMSKRKEFFKKNENIVLTYFYRRLNYFSDTNLDSNLIALMLPSEAKIIAKYGLIQTSDGLPATPRITSWYKLTEKGKEFFKNYLLDEKLSEEENLRLFNGKYVTFDKKYLKENQ